MARQQYEWAVIHQTLNRSLDNQLSARCIRAPTAPSLSLSRWFRNMRDTTAFVFPSQQRGSEGEMDKERKEEL